MALEPLQHGADALDTICVYICTPMYNLRERVARLRSGCNSLSLNHIAALMGDVKQKSNIEHFPGETEAPYEDMIIGIAVLKYDGVYRDIFTTTGAERRAMQLARFQPRDCFGPPNNWPPL